MKTRNWVLGAVVSWAMATLTFAASANAGGLLGGVGGGLGGSFTRSPNGIGGTLDGNIAGNAQFDRGSLEAVKSRAAQTTNTAKNAAKGAAKNNAPEPATAPAHHVNAAASADAE